VGLHLYPKATLEFVAGRSLVGFGVREFLGVKIVLQRYVFETCCVKALKTLYHTQISMWYFS
jgi:hypothetical protein